MLRPALWQQPRQVRYSSCRSRVASAGLLGCSSLGGGVTCLKKANQTEFAVFIIIFQFYYYL